jgi:hypothetical protein
LADASIDTSTVLPISEGSADQRIAQLDAGAVGQDALELGDRRPIFGIDAELGDQRILRQLVVISLDQDGRIGWRACSAGQ